MEQRSGVIENLPAFEEASGTQCEVADSNGSLTFINASPKATNELNVDDFLDVVGEYGCFQKLLTVLLGIMLFPFALNNFMIVFTAVDPEWRCVANSSICHFNRTFSPQDIRRCQMRRSDWEYTQTNEFSIVTAFDLACGKGWMVNLAQSVVFLGAIIGAIFLGWYSDNYGRKKVVFVCCFLITLMNFLSSFMPSIIWFIVLRFCSGFFTPSVPCLFVMLTEFVGNKKRAFAGNLFWQFYSVALCALSLKAYFITSWKILIWTCSLPYFILMVIYRFVPESVRWLRLKEKADKAVEIFQRIAKWNRRQLDSSMTLSKVVSDTEVESKTNPFDLFWPKEIAATTLL
ncbi:solute carrier family 22 member 3-like, partial [Clytia hemisphaerica]|uniref:solute carrier family 22 member 3-like n=1 Tax=Clytia hemisphaerica TaxID=252671 RepID=UPI0034D4840B